MHVLIFFRGPPGNPHDVPSPYKRPRPQSPVQQRPGYPYSQDPQSHRAYPGVPVTASVYPMYRQEFQVRTVEYLPPVPRYHLWETCIIHSIIYMYIYWYICIRNYILIHELYTILAMSLLAKFEHDSIKMMF